MKYAYYPGCSLHSTAKEYDLSTREVAAALGIELVEVPDWVCCGATPAHITLHLLSLSLPVKNLLQAKTLGLNQLVTCCAACFSRLKIANHIMKNDLTHRRKVEEVLGAKYAGEVEVKHFLGVLVNDFGLDRLSAMVKRNLADLKVACYYGCLLVRPAAVMDFDDPEDPHLLDSLVRALGATAVDWPYKVECCGASFSLTRTDIVLRLSNDILRMAKDAGAEMLTVACPLCQSNLDLR